MRTIDVHNHLYPRDWMEYLEKRRQSPRMERIGQAIHLYDHGVACAGIVNAGHYDVDSRLKDMDRCGIDTQVLSLTLPAVDGLPVDEGVAWARKINDYFAEVCRSHPGRFCAFATLPWQDTGEAINELERAYRELGVKGITLFSNVNFKPVSSPEFYPVFAEAERLRLPVFIHPAVPFTEELMRQHGLPPALYGFTLDTTLAVMGLIWHGVLERYPRLNIIHSHLGGIAPYLTGRMGDIWRERTRGGRLEHELPLTPSEYYRRQVYPDTMSTFLPAMRCCLDYVGYTHLCLGTDYAHGIGNWEGAIDNVKSLELPEEATNQILGGNAARILGIE